MLKKIQPGDKPADVLTQLKTKMQEKITAAGQSPDSELKLELAQQAAKMHFSTMGDLSKIYTGKIEQVEQLKQDIRSLYEKAQNQVERYKEQLKASQPRPVLPVVEPVAKSVAAINTLITDFRDNVLQYGGAGTKGLAVVLALKLWKYSDQYKEDAISDPSSAAKQFIEKATTAINEAKPALDRDLGWGDYLTNLAKQFVNAVTTFVAAIVHSGASAHQGFFTLQHSISVQAAEKLKQDITAMPVYDGR
tara:strand:- start:951 stop:1697 length:747 start_codon:yes stop_codon:yes gene_type:complete